MRSTPVVKSLLRPLVVKGCGYDMFAFAMVTGMGVLFIGFLAGHGLIGLLAGIATFAALFKAGQWITEHDPQLLSVIFCPLFRRRYLDHKKFRDRPCAES
jgi:hypothetical protein